MLVWHIVGGGGDMTNLDQWRCHNITEPRIIKGLYNQYVIVEICY